MSWVPVAKKEFIENVRNAWIIAMTAVFLILVLLSAGVISAVTRATTGNATFDMDGTIAVMRGIAGFLLPIMALMLGFATLAGERESGSLGLLVAQPLSRHDIVLGKFLGLLAVMAISIVVGLGGGGLLVLTASSNPGLGFQKLFTFVLATLLWGAAWTAITLFVSAFFRRRGTAIAGSLLAWFFFSVIYVPIVLLIVAVTVVRNANGAPVVGQAPSWLVILQVLNPDSAYASFLQKTIGGFPGLIGQIIESVLPTGGNAQLFFLALLAWIVVPYWGAYALFRSRDV